MIRYALSRKAEDDLIGIYRHSYLMFGEQQADLYVGSLEQGCQLFSDYPLMNRGRDEFTPPVRTHHHQKTPDRLPGGRRRHPVHPFLHDRMNIGNHLEGDNED
jgi:plasmid stabilization system protein ParE